VALKGTSASEAVYDYLSPVDRPLIASLIQEIDSLRANTPPAGLSRSQVTSWKGTNNRTVGLKYEELIKVLFQGSQVFSATLAQRTTIGEIDVVLAFSTFSTNVPFLNGHSGAIGEAKCHKTNLKSEWVTELSGNLVHSSHKFGIIFTFCSPKKVPAPSIQALKESHLISRPIIPFGRKQFDQVVAGEPILKIMADQFSLAAIGAQNLWI
jgi:hypothetical protein